jgi:16S rRNA (uracil1498-N3)-methyltransferase
MARVSRLGRSDLEVVVERIFEASRPDSGAALYVAGIRVERLSLIAEKATELGAARLVLVRAERTQAFRAAPALRQRLERVARAAAKQCGAARWPEISGPLETREALRQETAPRRFFLDPEGGAFPSSLSGGAAALAVGPEGGWSSSETKSARELGWILAALPAGRLRAETAAIAGLVLLRAAVARSEQPSSAAKAKR